LLFKLMRTIIGFATLLGALCTVNLGSAQEVVRVAAVHFPPYMVHPESGVNTGLLPGLLTALNQLQDRYTFVLVPTSLPRRFQELRQGRVDIAIFENPNWGWQDVPHTAVALGIEDAEVFVGRRAQGEDEHYFDTLADKRLALYSGYHYAFAGFRAEPEYLTSHYRATLTYSHDSNLLMVARNRADVALVTRSYLRGFYERYPELRETLVVARHADQLYQHYALLRPQAPISAAQLASYLARLHADGTLARLFGPYQIKLTPQAEGENTGLPLPQVGAGRDVEAGGATAPR
jgi:ABC-type amino acid transport substrate-binding protein